MADFLDRLSGLIRGNPPETKLNGNAKIIKVGYFPPEKYNRELTEDEKNNIFKHKEVWWYFVEQQGKKIVSDIQDRFKGRPVAVRSIYTSLTTDQEVSDGQKTFTIINANKLLQNGSEYPGAGTILAARLDPTDSKLPERPTQYTYFFTGIYKNSSSKARENITPAIVVYDLSLLTSLDRGYKYQLPIDQKDRSQAILAVYPIDVKPLSPRV